MLVLCLSQDRSARSSPSGLLCAHGVELSYVVSPLLVQFYFLIVLSVIVLVHVGSKLEVKSICD